ncbi:hypothetical protein A176_002305 [Myxococcus hansupus]|uniref:Uncharacterized protein n=1 Tax=Pseudomyxococcus hansupus TaxID=1297742 RepID=A0A0H4WUX1_9BACT|nr:hypothetical protein [Myxococcus hansupus]AKQ65393.1 hypothetical protein A176_002305 [Myxococcus hansupus]
MPDGGGRAARLTVEEAPRVGWRFRVAEAGVMGGTLVAFHVTHGRRAAVSS